MSVQIAFVDTRLADWQLLVAGLDPGVEVVLLDPERDGIEQIAEALDGRSDVDAIHLFSHGSAGTLFLGSTVLTEDTLDDYAASLATIGEVLTETGDLLLYGCNVAEGDTGQSFIQALAQYTQADVAASDDPTGSAALSGDWVLESATGAIDSVVVLDAATERAYAYTLDTIPTEGNDTLVGTSGNDSINGLGGNDSISGLAGNDTLEGGDGNDTLDGGSGNDSLVGGTGIDRVSYVSAASLVVVSLATEGSQFTSGSASDTLVGIEELEGSAFGDSLTGSANADLLLGLDGNDTLIGGVGDDTLVGGAGDDSFDGGTGKDWVSYASTAGATQISLVGTGAGGNPNASGPDGLYDYFSGIENIEGTAFNDFIQGDSNANQLLGLAGNDGLSAGGGDDTLEGGDGDDALNGEGGFDIASYASAASAVSVNLALSTAQGTAGAGSDTLGNLEGLSGSAFNDTLAGDGNANLLLGLAGNDTLSGAGGNDTLEGGAGNDSLDGGAGIDRVTYVNAAAAVTVSLATASAQNTVGAGTDTLANLEELEGSTFNDTLTGDGNANLLLGLAGNDTLIGGAGSDTLEGAAGDDSIDGGAGTDRATYVNAGSAVTVSLATAGAQNTGGAGTDTLANIEQLEGSAFNDSLTGSANADLLLGLADNDTLIGSAGNDTLEGGAGDDSIDGGDGVDFTSYAGAASAATVNLASGIAIGSADTDIVLNVEGAEGSAFDDTLLGNPNANLMLGGAGNDSLGGVAGDDTLEGGTGDDTLDGGTGVDVASYSLAASAVTISLANTGTQFSGGAGNDTFISIEGVTGSAFADSLTGDDSDNILSGLAAKDTLAGGGGNDSLQGGDGDDSLSGGDGDDTLIGGAGNDTLDGGPGADSMMGGTGNDIYYVDNALDVVVEAPGEGIDSIIASVSFTLSAYVENGIYSGPAGGQIYGNELDNVIASPAIGLSLYGLGGTDTISYRDLSSAITVNLATGVATIGGVTDALDSFENAEGGSANDTLIGNNDTNVLNGRGGGDTMQGGAGDDVYYVDSLLDLVLEDTGTALGLGFLGAGEPFKTIGDTVIAAINFALTDPGVANVENLTLTDNLVDAPLGTLPTTGSGNGGANVLTGNSKPNTLSGLDGDDTLGGGVENDTLDGGVGTDAAQFSGNQSAYATLYGAGGIGVVAQLGGGGDGIDRLISIETLQFADGTVALADAGGSALEYTASHADLIAAFGTNAQAALDHFANYGFGEGRQITFDGLAYLASYADLMNAFGANAEVGASHYISYGRNEGRTTSFDGLAYIASYTDLINAFGANGSAGASHYISYGRNEGRTTSFDSLAYIASYADLINAFGANAHAGASHYLQYGRNEGRTPSFDGLKYIASYTDLINAFGADAHAGADHYIRYGYTEGRQSNFDGLEYIASYGDLINAFGANASAGASHYISYGLNEGRTEHFNATQSLANYADLQAAFGSDTHLATIHFIQYGYAEGRTDA